MLLSTRNAVHFLLEARLLSIDDVVKEDIVVGECTRRNRNFKVVRGNGGGFFIKQAAPWDPTALETVRCEARCYWLATNAQTFAPLRSLVPQFHIFDSSRSVLVLELLAGAESVSEAHWRARTFMPELGVATGLTLGRYHKALSATVPSSEQRTLFPHRSPWIFLAASEPTSATMPSAGAQQLLELARAQSSLAAAVKRAHESWTSSTLIHGDIKWDNCLLVESIDEKGALRTNDSQMRIIDWELADFGDPAWDVGSILQQYVTFSIFSAPIDGNRVVLTDASFPIDSWRSSASAFLKAYLASSEPEREEEFVQRAVRFAGVRMIQSAVESLHQASEVSPHAVQLLQVASNILERPDGAEVFGL